MGELFRRRGVVTIATVMVGAAVVGSATLAQSPPPSDPPGRIGRLAFTEGTVSFHDKEQSGWTQAVVNTPLTSGDSVWTEPNAHSEISLAGTRLRLDGATQLDMLTLDDSQTRLQLDEGRVDARTFNMDAGQPYQIVTPRGTVSLLQPGDYYVQAGSTQDATRLGVRSGAAQIQSLNGQVVAVRPGEVAEIAGDAASPQLRTLNSAPPAQPAYWAGRDQQIAYDPPQYVSADVTGYEDLNAYGSWTNDGTYGEVWVPRSTPDGWAPYRTGRWDYVQPWGWTWVDEQPWGFAPYHYGRWANANNRWMWVPPEHGARAVYAPALVAFVGGAALAATLAKPASAPVGWFPLGPREAYVPPYTSDRNYYQRINQSARVEDRVLDERWQQAARHDDPKTDPQHPAFANQRFATVVPTSTFTQSQPVMRAALQVAPDKIATAPVAAAAAPPEAKPAAAERPTAPGPKFAATQPQAATDDKAGRPNLPPLAPRQGAAPPELKGTATPVPAQPAAKPAEAEKLQQAQPQATPPVPAPQARPMEKPVEKPAERPAELARPQQQATPPATVPQQHAQPEPPHQQAEPLHQPQAPAPPAHPREMQEGERAQEPQQPHQQPQQEHAAPQAQPHPQPQQQAAHPQPAPAPHPPEPQHAAPPPQPHPQPAPSHQEQAKTPEKK